MLVDEEQAIKIGKFCRGYLLNALNKLKLRLGVFRQIMLDGVAVEEVDLPVVGFCCLSHRVRTELRDQRSGVHVIVPKEPQFVRENVFSFLSISAIESK